MFSDRACLQDKEDDLKVGVKSTALRFGDSTKEWITGFGILCMSSLALSGYNAEIGFLLSSFMCISVRFFFPLSLLELQSKFSFCFCHILTPKSLNFGAGWPYYAFLSAASGQLAWQIWTADLSSRADCNRKCVLQS